MNYKYIINPSAGRTNQQDVGSLFNIDGVCLRRNAGNQSEVGFGVNCLAKDVTSRFAKAPLLPV